MSYVSDFAAQYPTSDYPVLLHFYINDQYRQAVIALKTAGAAVLAGGGTSDEKAQASTVMRSVLSYAARSMAAFCGDATVLASAAAPADADMLTAATWILPTLKSL